MTNTATMNNDTCPFTDSGQHKYFLFKTYDVFEPLVGEYTIDGKQQIYIKAEYGVLACNCGSVTKRVVT